VIAVGHVSASLRVVLGVAAMMTLSGCAAERDATSDEAVTQCCATDQVLEIPARPLQRHDVIDGFLDQVV
jgi:hypothetical protein